VETLEAAPALHGRGAPSEIVLNEEDGMTSPCAVNLHNAVGRNSAWETCGPA